MGVMGPYREFDFEVTTRLSLEIAISADSIGFRVNSNVYFRQ